MPHRCALGIIALALTLAATDFAAEAQDAAKYPDWSGQRRRAEGGAPRYDSTRRPATGNRTRRSAARIT